MILSRRLPLAASVLALCLAGPAPAQTQSPAPPSTSPPDAPVPAKQNDADQQSNASTQSERDKAAEQVRQQEKQRIAGVVPNFNVSYNADAAPLSRTQKLQIALRTATDPVAFGIAGFDAGLSQAQNDFPGYGQGAQGYAKRFGASVRRQLRRHLVGQRNLSHLVEAGSAILSARNGKFHQHASFIPFPLPSGARMTTVNGGRTTPTYWETWLPEESPTCTIQLRIAALG